MMNLHASRPADHLSDPRAPLLEVVCQHVRDVAGAHDGGADRLLVMARPEEGGRSPEPGLVSAVCKETDLPVRVLLRVDDDLMLRPESHARLLGLGQEYHLLGASGYSFGFLDENLDLDVAGTAGLAADLPHLPWGFSRSFDAALATDRAWQAVRQLPGIDAVATGGSSRGLAVGADDLIAAATASPEIAGLTLASGGLAADRVPWLVRAGIRQYGVGATVRPGRSWTRASVDAGHVRSWRMLLDDAADRAAGRPVE